MEEYEKETLELIKENSERISEKVPDFKVISIVGENKALIDDWLGFLYVVSFYEGLIIITPC